MPCPEATSRIVAPGKRSRCLSNDSANGVDQGSCWGRGQDGTAAFQCLTTLHRRYRLRARAQDGWQCGSLAESVCDILRRTRNGSVEMHVRRHGRAPVTETVPPTWAPEGAFAAFRGLGQ